MKNNHLSNDQSISLFDYPISYPLLKTYKKL